MNRNERVAEVFGDAADLDGAERAAFLDRACEGDVELRREVEELLRFDAGRLDSTVPARAAMHASAPAPAPPPVVGRFEIERVLGEGGMGIVYLAKDPTLSRRIAVKRLKGASLMVGRARLMREAQAMARITHPNVAAVFEVGVDAGDVFIAMELVDGGTLAAWLKTKHTTHEILEMFVQAGRGLAAAHRAGLLHRDFKPQNVLVGSDGRPRVVDFGLARRLGEAETGDGDGHGKGWSALDVDLTSAGDVMGTPGYMSPEHFEGNLGPASDQWSFAASLYRAVYGKAPFSDEGFHSIREAVLAGALRKPPASDVSVEVEHAILRGLSRHPEDRFATLDEMLDVIAEVLRRDPNEDRTRFARQRRLVSGLLLGWVLVNLVVLGVRTGFRFDIALPGVIFQGALGVAFIGVAYRLGRKTAFSTSHNRKVLAIFAIQMATYTVHRTYAYFAGGAVPDVLRVDALVGIAFFTYGALFLERWFTKAIGLLACYLVASFLFAPLIVPGFGVALAGVVALATWSWPIPKATVLGRQRTGGSSSSSSG